MFTAPPALPDGTPTTTPSSRVLTPSACRFWRETFSIALGALGLVVDRFGIEWTVRGEYIIDATVWSIFVVIFFSSEWLRRYEMLAVLVVFTAAELCFTEGPIIGGPHYYEYREGEKHRRMPLFVPPTHWLLLNLGRRIASHLPLEWTWALMFPLVPPTVYFAYTGADTCGILFLGTVVILLRWGPQPRLYATMTWLALVMEIEGTRLGNWEWYLRVPFPPRWTVLNPPLLIGVGYAFFDLTINVIMNRLAKSSEIQSTEYLQLV